MGGLRSQDASPSGQTTTKQGVPTAKVEPPRANGPPAKPAPTPAATPAPTGTDLALGAPCAKGTQCKTGFCVDGVCCGMACNFKCQACSAAKLRSGAPDGTCAWLEGNDPDKECGAGKTCDGFGGCVTPQAKP
jgi:hypothetical protein